jgi:hypothetical protein
MESVARLKKHLMKSAPNRLKNAGRIQTDAAVLIDGRLLE